MCPLTHDDITKPRKSKNYGSSAFAELRIMHGYTQMQLAEKIGAFYKSVGRWESGKCQPSARYIKSLATLFGCSTDVIIDALLKDEDAAEHGGNTDDE